MKLIGMGYGILRVTREQLRELHKIPEYIEFTQTLETNRSAWNSTLPPGWYHDEHPFYFRMQHRYLTRTSDRGPLQIWTLRELLKQCEEVSAMEKERKGVKIPDDPQGMYDHWVNDDE